MSRRPSSNTAKRPIGPAPMMATSVDNTSFMQVPSFLSLFGGRGHDQAVQRFADLDLAGEPRAGTHLEGEVEHVLLHLRGFANDRRPFRGDIDVAGRAGAGPAALGLNAWNGIAQRRLHHRRPDLRLDG